LIFKDSIYTGHSKKKALSQIKRVSRYQKIEKLKTFRLAYLATRCKLYSIIRNIRQERVKMNYCGRYIQDNLEGDVSLNKIRIVLSLCF
jgi:hypothetical protein